MNKDASLDRYIERVREIPKLSREDEHALAVAARDGDRAAADRIVEANLRYVVAVALQYRRYGIRLGDLIAEGNVGLMTAIRKFDPDRGTRFVTYAGYWIRAFVLEAVVRSASMVGGGSGPLRSKLFFRLRRERARLANAVTDQTELVEKMAERFDMSPTKMERMLQRLDGKDVSLDATLYDDAGRTLLDQLEGTVEPQDEHLARRERRAQLAGEMKRALRVLDRRERLIVERRMLADDGVSLAAIGRQLGVSRERARQLEARAKRKLRVELSALDPAA
ncbi:MAG: sigma-70 family RNA polymerase sigma factor [Myxococcales bacterium]|nr:sigma-70 family RNA polymerase sigma factor [Myxococcales bacterium]